MIIYQIENPAFICSHLNLQFRVHVWCSNPVTINHHEVAMNLPIYLPFGVNVNPGLILG